MKSRFFTLFLVGLSLLSSDAFSFGRRAAREDRQSEVSQLIHLIQLDQNTRLYGAGILFKANESQAYILTAAHVLPDEARWKDLRVRGQITADQMSPVEVLGISPGYDVAVLGIRLAGKNEEFARYDALARKLLSAAPPQSQVISGGIIGYPDYQPEDTPWVRRMSWSDELAWLKDTYLGLVHGPMNSSIPISLSTVCPMLFANECYHFPVKSWGYSGGALFSEAAQGSQILGMVTHYSPLASETYALPISQAIRVAEELVVKANESGHTARILEDETGFYRFVSNSAVEILKGSLSGVMVSGLNALSPGGGDAMHGGGDAMHGGGDAMHGGGDAMHGGGGVAFDASASRLQISNELKAQLDQQIPQPTQWFSDANSIIHFLFARHPDFKGIDGVLGYSPGVRLGERVYHGWESNSETGTLDGIQDFISVYRSHPDLKLDSAFALKEFPTMLRSVKPGVYSTVSLRPKSSSFLGKLMGQEKTELWEFSLTGTSTRGVQGTVVRNGSQTLIAVSTISDQIESHDTYEIAAPIAQIGAHTYEYIGTVQAHSEWSVRVTGVRECFESSGAKGRMRMHCTQTPGHQSYHRFDAKSFGMLRVQYDSEHQGYELKMILTSSPYAADQRSEVSSNQRSWGSTFSGKDVPVEFTTIELPLQ
jgi:hypothetical protein